GQQRRGGGSGSGHGGGAEELAAIEFCGHGFGLGGLGGAPRIERGRASSKAFFQRAATMVARPLAIRLVTPPGAVQKRAVPPGKASRATGILLRETSVAASATNPAPATPAEPLEVNRQTASRTS